MKKINWKSKRLWAGIAGTATGIGLILNKQIEEGISVLLASWGGM